MIEYKCMICDKIFKQKSNFISHKKRKYPCIPFPPKPSLSPSSNIILSESNIECEFCNKKFTRQDNLSRHIKGICYKKSEECNILSEILEEMKQNKKTVEVLKEVNNELIIKIAQLENKNLSNTINSNNNSNNIVNTQNNITNIQLTAFGKEELEQIISDEICKKILFKGFEAVPGLIEYVHFNKERPEYHNCFISNMRDKYAITYDGSNWNLNDANDVINTLRDDKQIFLENKFEEFYDSLDKITQKKFKKFLQEKDSDVIVARYKESIRLLLYNKRNIVKKTKNTILGEESSLIKPGEIQYS